MANHKSALKRHKQSLVRRARNRANRSEVKNLIRGINDAVTANSLETAQEALKKAIPIICRAANKGAFHKRNASRKVSRLTKKVNALSATATQAA